jgi:predicted nucleotidyltransferase
MSFRAINQDMPGNLKPLKSLKTFFKGRPKILLAFLFGSFASNCSRPSSDVDIGILFETVPDIYVINGITEDLSSILQREADLVVLNLASPVMKMQILKNGTLLYAIDKKYFHQFFADTVNEYDDLKRIRKNCEDSILKGRIYAR